MTCHNFGRLHIAKKILHVVFNIKHKSKISEICSSLCLCDCVSCWVNSIQILHEWRYSPTKRWKKGKLNHSVLAEKKTDGERLKKETSRSTSIILSIGNGQFTIKTDACDNNIGCALLQEQETRELRSREYFSRTLNDAETNYDTKKKSFQAVVLKSHTLRTYVVGIRFFVLKDF